MKRLLGVLVASMFMLNVVACTADSGGGTSNNSGPNTTTTESSTIDTNETDENNNKDSDSTKELSLDNTTDTEKNSNSVMQLELPEVGDEVAIIETNMGIVKVRLFPEYAPLAVENFVTHSKNGYYDGLTFHRIIKDFMIQGGDPEGTGLGGESIWGEEGFAYEFVPELHHIEGALSMAHSQMPNSNGSQFFIVQQEDEMDDYFKEIIQYMLDNPDEPFIKIEEDDSLSVNSIVMTFDYDAVTTGYVPDTGLLSYLIERLESDIEGEKSFDEITISDLYPKEYLETYLEIGGAPFLDYGYTVFGQVYEGIDVINKIANLEVKLNEETQQEEKPVEDVIIEKIEIVKYE